MEATGGGTSVPTINVSLSASSGSASVSEGTTATTLAVNATSTGKVSTSVVPDLQYDHAVFSSVAAVAGATAGTYVVTAKTLPDLAGGEYKGNISFRLCQEAACTHVYAGSVTTYAYNIVVKLKDWQTYQRNASHTAYVNVTLDPAKFTQAWTWNVPITNSVYDAINSVSTGGGMVYVTRDGYFFPGSVYALKESDGALAWSSDMGSLASEGPAAYADGKIYVPAVNASEDANIWVFNATNGTYLYKMPFASQWTSFLAPTPFADHVYGTTGSGGGDMYSYAQSNGDLTWKAYPSKGTWGFETPAVDQDYIYYNSGSSLEIMNRSDGSLYASIDDPLGSWNGYDYYGSSIIGNSGLVMSLSGNMSTGMAMSSSEPWGGRILTAYDIPTKSIKWRTNNAYLSSPAYAKGVIYATRNGPERLDAISEVDGTILWSWVPPGTDTGFRRNIIVTNNLVFVSTDTNLYAIDLITHQKVWSIANPGLIAISPDFKMYITTGNGKSDGKLVAIKLN